MKFLFSKDFDQITVLTINRPEVLNAISTGVLEEIDEFLDTLLNKEQCKALIITGAGNKAFIAGADIKEMQKMNSAEMLKFCELGQRVANKLQNYPIVTIAAINGFALGAGFELALACDLIYACKEAKLGLPEITLGLIPGFGGTQRLIHSIGIHRAKEFILTGDHVSAEEAKAFGVVNGIFPIKELQDKCMAQVKKILSYSVEAALQAKAAINAGKPVGLETALVLERNLCALCFNSDRRREAMESFFNKHSH